jgi:hypothetical protein
MAAVDGIRWESSVAMIGGFLASGICTKIADKLFIEASGTIFTTDYNTWIWVIILKEKGLLGRDDVWFFIHGDDLNIVAKSPRVLEQVLSIILGLGIADQDEWDTYFNFYLGMCKHPDLLKSAKAELYYNIGHPIGIKLFTDDPDHSNPGVLNRLLKSSHTWDEQIMVADLYTGYIVGEPTLSYFGGADPKEPLVIKVKESAGRSHEGVKTYVIEQAIEKHDLPIE